MGSAVEAKSERRSRWHWTIPVWPPASSLVVTACTGRGGGQRRLDNIAFKGPASFGFSFSYEDKGGLNPPTGQLHIELSYTDHGRNPIGSSFSIHGIVDVVDPVLESAVCIGRTAASRWEGADLPGPLPAGRHRPPQVPADVSEARDGNDALVSLRGHRAGQRHERRPVAGRLLRDQPLDRHSVDLGIRPVDRLLHAGRPAIEREHHRRLTPRLVAMITRGHKL